MEPTLRDGSTVLASGIPYFFSSPGVGDLVVFLDEKSDTTCIKKIGRVEGEKYFLVGENKEDSFDSKQIGLVLRENIIGKVVATLRR